MVRNQLSILIILVGVINLKFRYLIIFLLILALLGFSGYSLLYLANKHNDGVIMKSNDSVSKFVSKLEEQVIEVTTDSIEVTETETVVEEESVVGNPVRESNYETDSEVANSKELLLNVLNSHEELQDIAMPIPSGLLNVGKYKVMHLTGVYVDEVVLIFDGNLEYTDLYTTDSSLLTEDNIDRILVAGYLGDMVDYKAVISNEAN